MSIARRSRNIFSGVATPLLSVELAIHRTCEPSVDKRHILLAGGAKKSGNRKNPKKRPQNQAPGALEVENAARDVARGTRVETLAGVLAALAHPQRLEILLKLLGGECTHRALAKATDLKAGPLYHHLRELRMAGLIGPKVRDLYTLTAKGGRAILAALALERVCR
jgi:DNA-binding transcriptional ArsR family regulator